jgi:N-acylglucosamine-6-phosphate 2-epimerase
MRKEIIQTIKGKIIVSCQASLKEPLYQEECMNAVIASVINGGTSALRLAGIRDVKNAKKITDVPVIGITKPDPLPDNWKEVVYITPSISDAQALIKAGADIIAFDGTSRKRPKDNLNQVITEIKNMNALTMADVATLEEGLMNRLFGADIISTTLSGYTKETADKDNGEPDFELLKKLVKILDCPVIMEGRIWTPDQAKKAFDLGAHSVVIGSAITRPQLITKRFVQIQEK